MNHARRAIRIRGGAGAAAAVLAWRQYTPSCEQMQEQHKRHFVASIAATPSLLSQPALLHNGAVLGDQNASLVSSSTPSSSSAPAGTGGRWYGWGGGAGIAGGAKTAAVPTAVGAQVSGAQAPVALPSTGKQVLKDICDSFARIESNRGQLSDSDGLPSHTLVHALQTTTLFFPVLFGSGVFSSLILRKVGRHIAQLNSGVHEAAAALVDAPPEMLYTCGRRAHGPPCPRPTAVDEGGTLLLYPIRRGTQPAAEDDDGDAVDVMVPWAHVLDMRDVVLWELASKGPGARDDRHSVIHALQWSFRLLYFMLVFMDTMLIGTSGGPTAQGGRRTPNAAAREAYDKAFRPHHNIMQVSAARTGIAFVTHSRTALVAQMGFSSEQEAEKEMSEAAAALRPVVQALQVFMLENGLDKGGNHGFALGHSSRT